MVFNRRNLNISLLLLAILLGGLAVRLSGLPPLDFEQTDDNLSERVIENKDTLIASTSADALVSSAITTFDTQNKESENSRADDRSITNSETPNVSEFDDIDPRELIANHPFRKEALKIINNDLEETDSISRRKILSYCEHLRTSYTTKDIDFIRQVFSDNALIIVGNVVKTGKKSSTGHDSKVTYAVRSKQAYLSRLAEVFNNNDKIKLEFNDFHIMRHPSMKGIYGVSLRQKYSTDKYSDDGYLFLLWDFRNPSMPQIHVRTWQPHKIIAEGEEIIDISDFNIE
ncbi:MAG: hypothetical protein K2K97_04765 [Muribaculaceae bacterium]|nr:hypothetical protein [Muribaculaceae bacterium]